VHPTFSIFFVVYLLGKNHGDCTEACFTKYDIGKAVKYILSLFNKIV